jgi:outer membrane protein assembly factor BamB
MYFKNRKLILWASGIVVFFFLALALESFLSTGKIVVETSDPNSLILINRNEANKGHKLNNDRPSSQGQGKLVASLKTGEYTITVSGKVLAASQVVKIKAHQTQKYTLKLPKSLGVEPVANVDGYDVAADDTRLIFIEASSGNLYQVHLDNTLSILDSGKFNRVSWANPDYGIAQDASGRLHVIQGGALNLLTVPFTYGASKVSFAVAPNKEVYASNGSDVYKINFNGKSKKIYTAKSDKPALVAANGRVAVIDSQEVKNKGKQKETILILIDESGSVKVNNEEAYVAAWSPSGKYLAISSDTGSKILDGSLRKVATVPAGNINSPVWLDDGTLLYGTADKLWMYKLNSMKAEVLAAMPEGGNISELTVSANKSYVYLTASNSRNDSK